MFPDAPLYTSAYDAQAMPAYYRTWDIRTSFLQRLVAKRRTHRFALLLYPLAFESFDLSGYDLVISSSSAFAKGVITPPHALHVCYTHAPMRYAWSNNYVQNERMSGPVRALLAPGIHYMRLWDAVASNRVDYFVANSHAVSERIRKFYRRECEVVFPPVDTDRFHLHPRMDDYYILVSRFVPYKRLDMAVEAFTRLGRPLKVVGDGRQMKTLAAGAGPTVQFMGRVDDVELPELLARARAYIMPGEEDFGIAAVEANACGLPVIAYGAGGALDTQVHEVTGVLYGEQSVEALCEAVCHADSIDFDPVTIRAHAQRFDTRVFQKNMETLIAREMTGGHAALRTKERVPFLL